MRKAVCRWKRAWLWVLLAVVLAGCAAAVYAWRYTDDVYAASYAFRVTPHAEQPMQAEDSVAVLAADCQRLTEAEDFRRTVLADTRSDGKSRVKVEAVAGSLTIRVKVWGPDAHIVQEMANGIGRQLCSEVPNMLWITQVAEEQAALTPDAPVGPPRIWMVLLAAAGAFVLASLLACCFGRADGNLHFDDAAVRSLMIGAVASTRRCLPLGRGRQSQYENGMILPLVSRLIRENVRQIAMVLRSHATRGQGCSIVLAPVKEDRETAPVTALIASELASQGFKVLLMELNAEKPLLRLLLDTRPQADLLDYLSGQARLNDVLSSTRTRNLYFVDWLHPNDMIDDVAVQPSFAEFLQGVQMHFDFILLHAADVSSGCEAAMLSLLTDGMILMVRDGAVSEEELEAAACDLEQMGQPANGVIFTGVRPKRMQRYD